MKRLFLVMALLAAPLLAQEHASKQAESTHEQAADHGPGIGWKWANFAILVAGLGYLVRKHAPPFFHGRTEEIQRGMAEAAAQKRDAEARAAAIEQRLKNLETEIAGLRDSAHAEIKAEAERASQETARVVAKIEQQAEQDIASTVRHARQELKAYTAGLSVELAASRIRAGMTPASQAALADAFVVDLRRVV